MNVKFSPSASWNFSKPEKENSVWGLLMPELIRLGESLHFAYWNRGAFCWWSTILDIHLLCKLTFNSHTHLNMFFFDTVRNPRRSAAYRGWGGREMGFGPEHFLPTASNINCFVKTNCGAHFSTLFFLFFFFFSSMVLFPPVNISCLTIFSS